MDGVVTATPPAHRRRVQMARAQTNHRGRVARDGSRLWGMPSAARRGSLARSFSVWRAQSPPRGRPLTNRRWQRSSIVKERQLTGLKRSHNQMAGSGRPPTVSTLSGISRTSASMRAFVKPPVCESRCSVFRELCPPHASVMNLMSIPEARVLEIQGRGV
jgi:hypothetical protein